MIHIILSADLRRACSHGTSSSPASVVMTDSLQSRTKTSYRSSPVRLQNPLIASASRQTTSAAGKHSILVNFWSGQANTVALWLVWISFVSLFNRHKVQVCCGRPSTSHTFTNDLNSISSWTLSARRNIRPHGGSHPQALPRSRLPPSNRV